MRTIAAISSPPGPGRRGVIRISGPLSREIARATFRSERGAVELASRAAQWGRFDDGRGSQPALLLWMPAPRSFTREDVVELHLPGSPPLLACALERVLSLGAELAEPGEFTRRAFEHGRLDLTRVEGVLALVHAAGEAQRRAAAALLFGGLERRVEELRASLEELRALCEASLDFDERDTGHVGHAELAAHATAAIGAVEAALAWEERREPLAGLPRVALVGAPNAGKSSLFNLLTGGRALVSEHAGTTREPLRAVWSPGGLPCVLADTAGLAQHARETQVGSEVAPEAAAQELARAERASADLFLWVIDARRQDSDELETERRTLFSEAELAHRLVAWNKVDLPEAAQGPPASLGVENWMAVSARTGAGCGELARRVQALLGDSPAASAEPSADAGLSPELSIRHRRALELARERLHGALASLEARAPLDLVAEDLREATDALDQIAGRTTPEDLLDRLFARFCLGK